MAGTKDDETKAMEVDDDDDDVPSWQQQMMLGSHKKVDIQEVTIHPLVLLSVADHYHRVARGTRKRVVGVLLGQVNAAAGKVDATNSFAVPFEEDSKNPAVFYLDHNYLETMLTMFRKVNAKERVVGFYSTGPQIRPNDLRIYDICQRFTGNYNSSNSSSPQQHQPSGGGGGNNNHPCVFCIIDIRPGRVDLPVTSYKVTEEMGGGGSSGKKKNASNSSSSTVVRTFAHVASIMGAMEAEEVGVEHLLRDVHDPTVSTVASLIQGKLAGLSKLREKLLECKDYLESCARGDCKVNAEIMANLQTILSLLPNLNTEALVNSMMMQANDMHMAIYIAALIRTVIALHDLINNKIRYGHDGMEMEEEEKKQDDASSAATKKEDDATSKKDDGKPDVTVEKKK